MLAEACFFLTERYQRERLKALLARLGVTIVEFPSVWWDELFDWLQRYGEHEPDLVDGQLAIVCSREPTWRVWTYDREFRTTWRRANGSRIPVLGAAATRR